MEKLFPDPFLKKSKLNIVLDQYSEVFIYFVFIVCQFESNQNIMKLNCRPFNFKTY